MVERIDINRRAFYTMRNSKITHVSDVNYMQGEYTHYYTLCGKLLMNYQCKSIESKMDTPWSIRQGHRMCVNCENVVIKKAVLVG